jgi:hypothetical protein
LDVVVVLSDRKLSPADARDTERLEAMARKDGWLPSSSSSIPMPR